MNMCRQSAGEVGRSSRNAYGPRRDRKAPCSFGSTNRFQPTSAGGWSQRRTPWPEIYSTPLLTSPSGAWLKVFDRERRRAFEEKTLRHGLARNGTNSARHKNGTTYYVGKGSCRGTSRGTAERPARHESDAAGRRRRLVPRRTG